MFSVPSEDQAAWMSQYTIEPSTNKSGAVDASNSLEKGTIYPRKGHNMKPLQI